MKWLSARYAYPLVMLALLVSIVLQLAWLWQLHQSQQNQLRQELESLVSTAAQKTSYNTIARGHEQSTRFREFFLSPEWLNLRQAFDDLKVDDLHSEFRYGISNDSSVINLHLSFLNNQKYKPHSSHRIDSQKPAAVLSLDRQTFRLMDSTVKADLKRAAIETPAYFARYNYDNDRLDSVSIIGKPQKAAYISKHYTYNLKFLHRYQLVIPSLTRVIIYRMRFYLLSSLFMLLLTGAVFYFILKLMRNQRLYAQARSAFTSNMTHELKTPVATIAIALESIADNELEKNPALLKSYLEISRSELRRLNLMIEKVLNLEQMDNGEAHYRKELFDVQQGLQQVVASMRLQTENNAAEIIYQPLTDPCFVSGDPVHLTNVFYNLVENALKYGGKNTLLQISIKQEPTVVSISFQDNGPGIAPIYQQRVFERFFRLPAGVSDIHNVKGSGLGLHYVEQVTRQHGGRVTLQSEPGKGCNFTLYLPLAL
ncbi:MAG: HAMP domain-containing sensor histidine kinase [Mucilaginibacter sp.]|uniref:sensor histidine kinase n=1 Tax=Mucilaginibacter sp. TaxID=1882438 RepID=UPI0032676142